MRQINKDFQFIIAFNVGFSAFRQRFLMRNFATESGKSKGQFYTPSEVSRVIAKNVGIGKATSNEQTLYDPTCGSGSLLLKPLMKRRIKSASTGRKWITRPER
jgi:type I restriction-modification system DNA methylase subunit